MTTWDKADTSLSKCLTYSFLEQQKLRILTSTQDSLPPSSPMLPWPDLDPFNLTLTYNFVGRAIERDCLYVETFKYCTE